VARPLAEAYGMLRNLCMDMQIDPSTLPEHVTIPAPKSWAEITTRPATPLHDITSYLSLARQFATHAETVLIAGMTAFLCAQGADPPAGKASAVLLLVAYQQLLHTVCSMSGTECLDSLAPISNFTCVCRRRRCATLLPGAACTSYGSKGRAQV
jgi:hypothetical protein